MFNRTIDNKDLKFLQDRNKQLAFMNDIISNMLNIPESRLHRRPFDRVDINTNVSEAYTDYNKINIDIRVGGQHLKRYYKSSNPDVQKMCRLLKELDLLFKINSNNEAVDEDDYNYSICTFSKNENRKMYLKEKVKQASEDEILISQNNYCIAALNIFNMFGEIANNLCLHNDNNEVEIFYGDIDFAFKDWVE